MDAQAGAEFFNLPNNPSFNVVGRIINQPNFGSVLSQFAASLYVFLHGLGLK